MYFNFYLAKNHKIANNSTTTEAREKTNTYLVSLEFYNSFDVGLTTFKADKSLLNKILHRFLTTTRLFTW
jgi:hypothetical protein